MTQTIEDPDVEFVAQTMEDRDVQFIGETSDSEIDKSVLLCEDTGDVWMSRLVMRRERICESDLEMKKAPSF